VLQVGARGINPTNQPTKISWPFLLYFHKIQLKFSVYIPADWDLRLCKELSLHSSLRDNNPVRYGRYLSIYRWLYSPFLGLDRFFFSFLIFYTVGRTPWTEDQPVASPLPTNRATRTQNKRSRQISMPGVGFEPTIPAFDRTKTVHALDRAATVIRTSDVDCIVRP
jgi:hypothetical protein